MLAFNGQDYGSMKYSLGCTSPGLFCCYVHERMWRKMSTMPEPATSLSAPPSLLPWFSTLLPGAPHTLLAVFITPILALAAVLSSLLLIVLLHYLGPSCPPVRKTGILCLLWSSQSYLKQQLWDGEMGNGKAFVPHAWGLGFYHLGNKAGGSLYV